MSKDFILPTGKQFDIDPTSGGDDKIRFVSMKWGPGKVLEYTVPADDHKDPSLPAHDHQGPEMNLDLSVQVYAVTPQDVDQFNKLVSSMLSGSYKNIFDENSTSTRSVEGTLGGIFGLFGGSADASMTIEDHMGVYGLTDEQKSTLAKAFFTLTMRPWRCSMNMKVSNTGYDNPLMGNVSFFTLDVVVKSGSTEKTQRLLSDYPSDASGSTSPPIDITVPSKASSMFTLVPRGPFQHEVRMVLPALSFLTPAATIDIGTAGVYGFLRHSSTNTFVRTDSDGRYLFASAVDIGEALKFRLFINKTNLQLGATVNDTAFYLKRSHRFTNTAEFELSSSGGEDVSIQWKDGTSFQLDMDGNAASADVRSTVTELKVDSKIGNGHVFQFQYFDTPANPTMIANVMLFERMRIAAGDGTRHPERI